MSQQAFEKLQELIVTADTLLSDVRGRAQSEGAEAKAKDLRTRIALSCVGQSLGDASSPTIVRVSSVLDRLAHIEDEADFPGNDFEPLFSSPDLELMRLVVYALPWAGLLEVGRTMAANAASLLQRMIWAAADGNHRCSLADVAGGCARSTAIKHIGRLSKRGIIEIQPGAGGECWYRLVPLARWRLVQVPRGS